MVAISGGADSTLTACLMYNFFLKYKYDLQNLFFIHCNHNTRTSNLADEKFITTYFKGMQYSIVKRKNNKKSSEAELRNWRYGEFKKQIRIHGINQLIFGHNLTDRIESTFLNLLRGANLNGLVAMQTQETHHLLPDTQILRPILTLTKDDILHICKHNKIPFMTDPTNKDTTTSLRNKLRNKVLPELYKLAHKQTATTNSYIESMKSIYEQLEKSHGEKILNSEF
ncbi:TPA: tRNA lysidine(34) synthetase TilS [Patescibacteria group bacterium]|nr:tRNA lysidine(34) synthetase TilS [Candidatus Gracilibacteria bacterium]